jgi:hypothetical protein
MLRLTKILLLLSLAFLLPAQSTAGSNTKYRWQEGEILSRKTIPTGRPGMEYSYVYRIRSGYAHYLVVARQPLNVELPAPVKFARNGRQVLIQDSNGKESKASMLEHRKRAFGRWK